MISLMLVQQLKVGLGREQEGEQTHAPCEQPGARVRGETGSSGLGVAPGGARLHLGLAWFPLVTPVDAGAVTVSKKRTSQTV